MPLLSPGGEDKGFNYTKLRDEIYSQCSKKDKALIDLLEKGFVEENLSKEFYNSALGSRSHFVRDYYALDLAIRNKKVESVSKRLFAPETASQKVAAYSLDLESHLEQEDERKLDSIFKNGNIVEKEKELDDFKWGKINEFTLFDLFCIDNILAFLAKGKLVDRWNILDKEKGKSLFKKLVDEVRSTYDKTKLSYTTDENNG